MITINEEKEIYYDETKEFSEQSEKFQAYFNEIYAKAVTEKVTTTGYPKADKDGLVIFKVDDDLFYSDATRVQNNPHSTSNRSVKKTMIEIFVK